MTLKEHKEQWKQDYCTNCGYAIHDEDLMEITCRKFNCKFFDEVRSCPDLVKRCYEATCESCHIVLAYGIDEEEFIAACCGVGTRNDDWFFDFGARFFLCPKCKHKVAKNEAN